MNKLNFSNIISIIIIFALFFGGAVALHIKGKPLTDFCYNHYRNDSFLDNFVGNEPYILRNCCIENKTEFGINNCYKLVDNYEKCLYTNGTDDEVRFISNCHWMGADYFILFAQVISIAIGFMIIYRILFAKPEYGYDNNR